MILVKDCADVVSTILQVSIKDLYGDRKQKWVAEARMYVYWLAKEYTRFSLPRIGRAMRRDHSTILHGIRKINKLIEEKDERAIALTKQMQKELDDRFGDVDQLVIDNCHANEIKELMPTLAMKLYTLAKKISQENKRESTNTNEKDL
jgi:hypothetical protein